MILKDIFSLGYRFADQWVYVQIVGRRICILLKLRAALGQGSIPPEAFSVIDGLRNRT